MIVCVSCVSITKVLVLRLFLCKITQKKTEFSVKKRQTIKQFLLHQHKTLALKFVEININTLTTIEMTRN